MRRELLAALIRKCEHLAEARRLHQLIRRSDLCDETLLTNLIIQMYSRCGCIHDSLHTFTSANNRNIFTWNIMMAAEIQANMLDEAKHLFHTMPQRDLVSWNTVLSAFAEDGDLRQVCLVFLEIPSRTAHSWNSLFSTCARNWTDLQSVEWMFYRLPQHDVISSTLMISAYGRFHLPDEAAEFFQRIPHRDSVSWNAMLHVHALSRRFEDARALFERMPMHGEVSCNSVIFSCSEHTESLQYAVALFTRMHRRDPISWNSLMKAFADSGDLSSAERMFLIMPQRDSFSWTCMITVYSEHTRLQQARDVFDGVPSRDLVVWNAMLGAYAKYGQCRDCLMLFRFVDFEGMTPDDGTWLAVLEACGKTEVETEFCGMIVDELTRASVLVRNASLRMYTKRGDRDTSRSIFKLMRRRDVFSWNTMLATMSGEEQMQWFWKMPKHDMVSWNTAIGSLWVMSELDRMPEMNVVSWNALLTANAGEGRLENVLALLKQMDLEGYNPNAATLVSVLKAFSRTGTLDSTIREEILERNQEVAIDAMVNALGKCGEVGEALKLFESTKTKRDVVSWNGLISAYARNGDCDAAIAAYSRMQLEGVDSNEITLSILISACSHSGYLVQGLGYFHLLEEPRLEHYVCMADLFARCGQLELATDIVGTFPSVPECAWTSILSGFSNV